ncbi:hypothetical protein [uncultured Clostridium sp.]|uniref:hypothetical protein n=1 Tax=uncultured Clostridium sp. TaxID=59620 RepID=UPI0028E807F0|nr:hypothetical protein [uncultured Clostridium sp.]
MNSYKKKILEARKQVLKLTLAQEKQVIEIYSKAASKLIDDILDMPDSRTKTHKIDCAKIINNYTKELYENLNNNILENTWESSYIQRKVILDFADQVAPNRHISDRLKNNITKISDNAVRTLISGGYYEDGKTLSKRLWNITKENGKNIDTLIKTNIASGANVRTLANELEKYVNPKKRIVSKSFKAGINSYKISYNAQRLARTSITHAAAETQIQNAKKNPFSLGLKWNLSASHSARMHGKQDECDDREGKVYKPNETPLQHPNCLCFFTEEVSDIDDAIAKINKWVDGGNNEELDKWCEGYDRTNKEEVKPIKQNVKVNGKDGTMQVKVPKNEEK